MKEVGVEPDHFLQRLTTYARRIEDLREDAEHAASETHFLSGLLHAVQLLQSVLQNSAAGIAVVAGPEWIFHLANPAYQSCVPVPGKAILGQRYRDVWPEGMGINSEKLLRDGLNRQPRFQYNRLELRYPDGLHHSFSMQAERMEWFHQQGALLILQETTQTDHARQVAMEIAEQTYEQAEELDAIIRAMADAVVVLDSKGRVTRANPAAVELLRIAPVGYTLGELADALGARYLDGSPMTAEGLPFTRSLQGEVVAGAPMLIENDNGERVVRVSASPLLNEKRISGVITIWHDVTEREQLLEQLEIEQSRLQTIIENAPEAIVVADEEGRIVMANPAAEWIFGRVLPYYQDVTSLSQLAVCYNDGSPYDPRNLPLTRSAVDGEQTKNIEMLVHLPSGENRFILASSAPIVDRKGNLNGAVGVFQDYTRRKQAEEQLRVQAERSRLLANLSQEFAEAGLRWPGLLDTITEQIGKSLGDLCSLHLLTEDSREQYQAAVYAQDVHLLAFARSQIIGARFSTSRDIMASAALKRGQPLRLNHAPIEQVKQNLPDVDWSTADFELPDTVHALIAPLRAHGRWIGWINLIRFRLDNEYSNEDQAILQELAERAALAVENARLYSQEAQRARELHALHQAASALLSTIDLEALLAEILNAATQAIPAAEQGIVYLLSEKTGHLEDRARHSSLAFPLCDDVIQRYAADAILKRKPVLVNNIAHKPSPAGSLPAVEHSAIIAPLMQPGKVLGALILLGTQPALFSKSDLNLLDNFAVTATAALQNAKLYAEVQRLATTDALTEQYNRRRFLELSELEILRAQRFSTPLSAIMFDLDNFKEINDSYGHGAGDSVLQTIAQRCRASIRVIDILGRYGGDEFAILLPNANIVEAQDIAERIRQNVTNTPLRAGPREITLTISLGVTQADLSRDTLASLLGRADSALYTAKNNGRNQVVKV